MCVKKMSCTANPVPYRIICRCVPSPQSNSSTSPARAIASELTRLRLAVWNCLALADVDADQIDTIFVTGGSSLVPAVEAVIAEELPAAAVKRGDDFLSVALGLTLEAQTRYR